MQPEAALSVSAMTKQRAESPDPLEWTWVEGSVWTERMLTALGNGVKGGKWFSLFDKVFALRTLEAAWKRVAANRGAAGVDKMSIARFRANAAIYLRDLSRSLRAGSYKPEAVRRVYIPKERGKTRPLGIPTVKDRIVQAALKMVIEPIFEREFLPSSFGFRPERGCKDALRRVNGLLKEGYTWVVDADLKSYFDTIPHAQLLELIKEKISDGRVLSLIESYLEQDILDGMERWEPVEGSPQGAVISPLLANLYLHPLDKLMTEEGYEIVRYADDFVILCRTREEAEEALAKVAAWTKATGLTLHPDKTHIGDCEATSSGRIDFLGYTFTAGRRYVRKKSLLKIRESVRKKTRRRRNGNLEEIISDLNRTMKGWFEYFKHTNGGDFKDVDGYVRRRLRAILRRRLKRPGLGRTYDDHKRWPNAFFAEKGLFTTYEAKLEASQSQKRTR